MPKTITIEQTELAQLRKEIHFHFIEVMPHINSFNPNTYLGNYDELIQSMKERVPKYEAEFSAKRLVKLFYSTNLEKIPNPDIPTFGSRFIDGCYLYITEGVQTRADYFINQKIKLQPATSIQSIKRKAILISIIFILIATLSYVLIKASIKTPLPFVDEFDDVTFEGMKKRGWRIWNYNDTLFKKQPTKGYFSSYTTQGDIWVKSTEKQHLDNFIYQKIDFDCFEVITLIDHFKPQHEYQQAGLVLFREPNNFDEHIRLTIEYVPTNEMLSSIHVDMIYWRNHIPIMRTVRLQEGKRDSSFVYKNLPVGLYVSCQKGKFSIKMSRNNKGDPFFDIWQDMPLFPFPFQPKYVGLTAFRGISFNDTLPNNNPTIPAPFDYLKINPIPCEY